MRTRTKAEPQRSPFAPSVIRMRAEANHLHRRMLSPAQTLRSRSPSPRRMRKASTPRVLLSARNRATSSSSSFGPAFLGCHFRGA